MPEEIRKQIDTWVGSDPDNVEHILQALSEACVETGQHLASNWQDQATARAWTRVAQAIDKAQAFFLKNRPY